MIPILLLVATYTDIKTRTIPNIVAILIFMFGLMIKSFYLTPAIIFFVFMIILTVILEQFLNLKIIGGGDIKILSSLIFVFGSHISIILFCTLIPILFYYIYIKVKKINNNTVPLMPFLTIGYFLYVIGGIYV